MQRYNAGQSVQFKVNYLTLNESFQGQCIDLELYGLPALSSGQVVSAEVDRFHPPTSTTIVHGSVENVANNEQNNERMQPGLTRGTMPMLAERLFAAIYQ